MRGREINFEKLSEMEKGYLFGLFEGDGYKIHDKKNRHYHIEFYFNSLKDKKIIERTKEMLEKIGCVVSLYKDKRFNCMRVRTYSKDLFRIIFKNINLEDKNKDFKIGFLSGIIDSEGYVNPEKFTLMVVSTNKGVLGNCKKFLDSINIGCSLNERTKSKKDKLKSYRMYVSVSFKRLSHLSIKANKLK